jgi:hypothetical protein
MWQGELGAKKSQGCWLVCCKPLRAVRNIIVNTITFEHTAPVGAQLTYVNTVLKPVWCVCLQLAVSLLGNHY